MNAWGDVLLVIGEFPLLVLLEFWTLLQVKGLLSWQQQSLDCNRRTSVYLAESFSNF